MVFPALSSTPTVILVFWLDFLLLRRQLVVLLLLFLWCLTDHWQSCRDCLLRSPLLFLRRFSVPIPVVGVVVSFSGVILTLAHLRCPVSSFRRSRILVTGFVRLSAFLLFLRCSVIHMSVFTVDTSLLC
jgi:hypothetical protein